MLVALFQHMEWADAAVWKAVIELNQADQRLHRLLYHLHATQRAFLQVWQRVAVELPEADQFPDLRSIREWSLPYYEQALRIVSADETRHHEIVIMPWADAYLRRLGRNAEPTTFAETALQITSHSTYHRGQVNARVKELGGTPPLVDFIAWVWLGKPRSADQ